MLKIFNFVFLIAAAFVAIGILIGSLIISSNSTTERLANTTDRMHLTDDGYFGQNFMISEVHYFERDLLSNITNTSPANSLCLNPRSREIVIMKLIMETSMLPDRCDIMIDDIYVKELRIFDYDCRPDCMTKTIEQQIDLKAQNVFEDHLVKVCCDSICATRILHYIC